MNIIALPNFSRYESSFALLTDEPDHDRLKYFTIDEERLLRVKHTYGFPLLAMEYCLAQAGVESLDQIDLFVTDYARRPSLYNDGPGYRKLEHDYLKGILNIPREKTLIVNHHSAHAAGVFYPSGFEESAILIVDGMGSDLETQSIYFGDKDGVRCVDKAYGWGIGALYSEVTSLIGFTGLNGVDLAGKTMGLAPLGRNVDREILDICGKYDGIHSDYSSFLSRYPIPKIKQENLVPCPKPGDELGDYYTKMAFEVQREAEEALVVFANRAYELTKCENLCISGGVGLNSVANGKILENSPIKNLYVTPCCSDTGIALGLAAYGYFEHMKPKNPKIFQMANAFTGKKYGTDQVKNLLNKFEIDYTPRSYEKLADALIEQKILSWFVGGSEIGPRALGHRSILVDPRRKEMKDILNARVKHREAFRPFAPAILEEHVSEYFPVSHKTPFMLEVYPFLENVREKVGAVVHDDGTGRLQTVSSDECPEYYSLIKAFYDRTGVPILLNTSFNDKEPVVESPEDAIITFLGTDIDILVLEDCVIEKQQFSHERCELISSQLRAERKVRIEEGLHCAKEKFFRNFNAEERDTFLKEEEMQAMWYLKYRAKYELERFVDSKRENGEKVIIVGSASHTKKLFERIYEFPTLNVKKFIPFKPEGLLGLETVYNIGSLAEVIEDGSETILISCHEYAFVIKKELIKMGVAEDRIFTPYDSACDSLEIHLDYLPVYNPIP